MRKHPAVLGFVAVSLALALSSPARAQVNPDDVTPGNATGTQAYETHGGARENINLATGDLGLQIPLVSLPARNGLGISLGLIYDSKVWTLHHEYDPATGQDFYWWDFDRLGWQLNIPTLITTYTAVTANGAGTVFCQASFIVITSDGSKHPFDNRSGCTNYPSSGNPTSAPQYNVNVSDSTDATFLRLDSTNSSDIVLYTKGGQRLHFYSTGSRGVDKIEDTNGNFIQFNATGGVLNSITDNLGRSVTLSYSGPLLHLVSISFKDSNGVQQLISLAYTPVTIGPSFTNPPFSYQDGGPSSQNLLSTLTLPNNLTYTFQYDTWGGLTKITYPTGGYTRYDYAVYTNLWVSRHSFAAAADFREVSHRYVCRSANGSCGTEDTTTYTPTVDATKQNNLYMDVLDALANLTHHQFSLPASGNPRFTTREISRSLYQGQSTLLRTIQTDYNNLDSSGNTTNTSLPIRVTATLNDVSPNLVSKREWDYDTYTALFCASLLPTCQPSATTQSIDNVVEQREFAWGFGSPGALVRKSDHTWLKTNSVNGQDYTSTPIHILDRKASEQVKEPAGNIVAQTQYEYDSFTEGLTASGAVQHGSAFGASYVTRGNLTAAQHWRNTDGAWLTIRNQYDDAGNLRKTTDPNGHATTFSFADSWNEATCAPTGGNAAAYRTSATNALGQVATSKFNSCSGTIASTTDPNNQIASNSFDAMGRLTQTNLPDGGQTTRSFNEASLPRTLSTTAKITSTLNGTATGIVDGLGRIVQPQLNSDPQGAVYADTTYDSLERKSTVSNPYRSTLESTYGLTTYQYDGLGRISKVIPPDGTSSANNVSTSYSGACATVTDQAGKVRKSCSDALGRLTQVFEPDVSNNLVNETDYHYDVLNNLLCVHQRATDTTADKSCTDPTVPATWRPRAFTYNSLSQLLTASNPETGTVTYTYDSDGNVLTKKDARNITTTFYYDVLHRLTKKTFSDTSPQVTYWHDGQTPAGCPPTLTATNGIGRRTAMCDPAGWEAWSYDVTGRVLTERRNTNGVTKDTIYTYNLDGSLATATYPSGRILTYTVNAAGRPVSAVDVANGINYATNAAYGAFEALTSLQNGASLYSTFLYNTRLQPCWLYINTSSSGAPSSCTQTGITAAVVLDLKYDFGFSVNDNGNVNGLTNNRNTARTQNFTFDELNRLKTALTQATSGTQCFGLDYSYDIWGNLTATTLDSARPACSWTTLTAGIDTNNRLTNTGFSYDAAGNVLADGSFSYTWDAESELKTAGGVTYTYDGDGRRVQKSNGKLYWYGAGGEILDETDAAGNLTNEYVYFGGKRIARRDSSNNIYYYFADHLGSSRVIAQANGTVCYDADYDPFGKEVVATNTCPQSYKFSGKERDTETNLDDFGARYYSSQFERWISPDWSASPSAVPYAELVNPQSLNLYSYVRNNPVTSPDLDGHVIAQATMDRGSGDLGMGIGHWSPTTGPNHEDNAAPEFGAANTEQNTDTSNQPTAENSGDSADPAPDPQAQQRPQQQPQNQQSDLSTESKIGAGIGFVVGGIIGWEAGAGAGAVAGTLVEPGGGTVVVGIAGGATGAVEGAKTGAVAGAVIGALAPVAYTKTKDAANTAASQLERAFGHLGKLGGPDRNPNPRRGWKQTVRDAANQLDKQADRVANKTVANGLRLLADFIRGAIPTE
jgi:RHS repeat-associated protein